MTEITEWLMPCNEKGKDPNDHGRNPDIWDEIVEVPNPPEAGPHYKREGFADRAAAQVSNTLDDNEQSAWDRICVASTDNPEVVARLDARLANTKWFIFGLAAYGEITHFYGEPGAGKTLLWVSLLYNLPPEKQRNVIYLNFDDNGPSIRAKLSLIPNVKTIFEGDPEQWIDDLIASGDKVEGMVIILDTIKKFADIIQKHSVKDLFVKLRQLTAQGATVITLGHTNKHRNMVGDLVYEGVGDVKSDPDGLLLVERSTDPLTDESTIFVTPDEQKARAGQIKQAYRFAAKDQDTEYGELVRSCRELTPEQMVRERQKKDEQELREAFEDEIGMVKYFLQDNPDSIQTAIVDYWFKNKDNYGFGKPRLTKTLKLLTGHIWTMKTGANNSKIYKLIGDEYPIHPQK